MRRHFLEKDWLSTMEFQVEKSPGKWRYCSYSTYLIHRKKGENVRKRKVGRGNWTYNY